MANSRKRKQPAPVAYPGDPQRDLVAESPTTSPPSGGPWRAAVKVCRKCGKAVGRSERWRMVPAGPGLFAIEHRDPCGVHAEGVSRGCG